MSEYELGAITISQELEEMGRRLMMIEKRLGRTERVRIVKRWFMVVGLGIEGLAEEARRLEKERLITGA
jgi:hypothetical protein